MFRAQGVSPWRCSSLNTVTFTQTSSKSLRLGYFAPKRRIIAWIARPNHASPCTSPRTSGPTHTPVIPLNIHFVAALVRATESTSRSIFSVIATLTRKLQTVLSASGRPPYYAVLQQATAFGLVVIVGLSALTAQPAQADFRPWLTDGHITEVRERARSIAEVSTEGHENVQEAFRQLEAKLDAAVDALSRAVQMPTASGATTSVPETEEQVTAVARDLIMEVWEVVDDNYLDVRNKGFDHATWLALRDDALSRTYKDISSVHRAVRSMLARGLSDPYSRFLTPSEFEGMSKYDVTGIGLNLGTAEEFQRKTGLKLPADRAESTGGIWVVGLIKTSPADKVGIRQGDQVLAIDGVTVAAQSPFQAASLIYGADGSESSPAALMPARPSLVQLTVKKGDASEVAYTIERPVRTLPTPVSDVHIERTRQRALGYIKLSTFNARAHRDVSAAIRRLEAEGASELVLDLRDNWGGLVSEGIEVAKLFLDDNAPILVSSSRHGRNESPIAPGPPLTRKPLTVLVNERSASASEILAGALHDNCRAVLVGNQTFGKGLIQSVYALSDGSGLVTTVGKYLTPSMTDIDLSGIRPDFQNIPGQQKATEALDACRISRG